MCEEMLLHLKWDNFSSHLALSFDSCYETQRFVDVSLVCKNGEVLKGHKMILANSSKLFRRLLTENEHPHPMILMHNITADDMRSMMAFMYCGEVQVEQSDLKRFLEIAEILEVTGLSQIQESAKTKDVNNLEASNTSSNGSAKGSSRSEQDVRSTNSCNTSPPPLVRFSERPANSPKNLDCSMTSFESSSKKLQDIAKKFEGTTPSNRQSLDGGKSGLDILDRGVKSTGEFASSSRRLQEMAKSLENLNNYNSGINWNKLSKVISNDKAESAKRAHTDDTVQRPSKKSNMNTSMINVAEHEDKSLEEIDTKGNRSSNAQDDDQMVNTSVYIKDEIDMESIFGGNPAVYSMEMQAENEIQNRSITASSALKTSSILAAELLKGVARDAKDDLKTLREIIEDNFCKLFGGIARMKVDLKVIDDRIARVENRFLHNPIVIPTETIPFSTSFDALPLNTTQQITDFDDELATDFNLRSEFVLHLQRIGGNSTKDGITRILKTIFSNKVAQEASWLGQRNNFKICDLKIIKSVKDAVSVHFPHTEKEFEEVVSEWFRQAKQRFIREEKKKAPRGPETILPF